MLPTSEEKSAICCAAGFSKLHAPPQRRESAAQTGEQLLALPQRRQALQVREEELRPRFGAS
eukprot:6562869-Pyramimonas_sp.AAC.1